MGNISLNTGKRKYWQYPNVGPTEALIPPKFLVHGLRSAVCLEGRQPHSLEL